MRKPTVTIILSLLSMLAFAQEQRPFDTELVNAEHKVCLRINLYDRNLKISGQELLGEVDGYMYSPQSHSKWFIVDSEMKNSKTAVIEMVNDYGSEDLTAELKLNNDGTYTYKKTSGSTLKFAVRGKWQKLPSKIDFEPKAKKQ